MTESSLAYLPTVEQLLETEVFSEAQVLAGEGGLAKVISQVVLGFNPPPRPDSLVVTRLESLSSKEQTYFSQIAGIVLVRPSGNDNVGHAKALAKPIDGTAAKVALPASWPETSLDRLSALCTEAGIALITIPSLGELSQITEDVRSVHLKEVKLNAMRLHAHLLKVVLTEGLEGLVEQLSMQTNRPICVETSNFQLLASRNMGTTPASQQQNVAEQIGLLIRRNKLASEGEGTRPRNFFQPVKVGRRLILPIVLD